MADSNTTFNSDANVGVVDQRTNGFVQGAMVLGETDSDRTTRLNPRPIRIRGCAAKRLYRHQRRTRRKRRTPYIPMHDPSRFILGDAQPYLMNANDGLMLHLPYVNESTAVEDSRPSDMPAPIDGSTNTNAMRGNDPASASAGSNVGQEPGRTVTPAEYPYEYDHPTNTLELNSNQQLDAESESDERRSCPNSPLPVAPLVRDQGEVPINTGNATINTATANEQNATDITMNPGTTPQLLCSEIADRGGNVQASIIDVSQAAECNAAPLFNLLASKAPEAVHHNGESSTDSDN